MQYLPCKPIKHGIRGFVLAISGYVCSFEIYTRKDDELDGSPVWVVSILIKSARLVGIGGVGCILYMDNRYTSLDLLQHRLRPMDYWVLGPTILQRSYPEQLLTSPSITY